MNRCRFILLVGLVQLGCAPAIVEFDVSPGMLPVDGGVVSIRWRVTGTDQPLLVVGPMTTNLPGPSGLMPHGVYESTEFELVAGQDRRTVFVRVGPEPVILPLVSGRVVDQQGRPAAGRTVVIGSQSVVSSSEGLFALRDVSSPYSIRLTGSDFREATWYRLLSGTTPTLIDFGAGALPTKRAVVSGTVTDPSGSPGVIGVQFASADVDIGDLSSGSLRFALECTWRDPGGHSVTMFGHQVDYDPGGAHRWGGAASRELTLFDGQDQAAVDLTLAPVPVLQVPFAVESFTTEPTAVTVVGATTGGRLTPLTLPFRTGVTGQTTVPSLPGLTSYLTASDTGGSSSNGRAITTAKVNTSGTTLLRLHAPPVLSPANSTVHGKDQPLTWTAAGPHVCIVWISAFGRSQTVVTDIDELHLKDIELVWQASYSGSVGAWSMDCLHGIDGVSAATTGDTLVQLISRRGASERTTSDSLRFQFE